MTNVANAATQRGPCPVNDIGSQQRIKLCRGNVATIGTQVWPPRNGTIIGPRGVQKLLQKCNPDLGPQNRPREYVSCCLSNSSVTRLCMRLRKTSGYSAYVFWGHIVWA
jgi:hypothetical protein